MENQDIIVDADEHIHGYASDFYSVEEDLVEDWSSGFASDYSGDEYQPYGWDSYGFLGDYSEEEEDLQDHEWLHWIDENGENCTDADVINNAVKFQFVEECDYKKFTEEWWRSMGIRISNCKTLKEINLHQGYNSVLDHEKLTWLFQADGPYAFPLERLILDDNGLGGRALEELLPFLKLRGKLHLLSLAACSIEDEGARVVTELLNEICIHTLDVSCNGLSAEGISRILESKNSKNLRDVHFEFNSFGMLEIEKVARFLSRPKISLESITFHIDLDKTDVTIWPKILLQSLRYNTTTKELHLDDELVNKEQLQHHLTTAMTKLVCDTSCFEAFCESNNVLKTVAVENDYTIPPTQEKALLINARSDISSNQKLRCKIQSIYFQENFDANPFRNMKSAFMPNLLELAALSTSDSRNGFAINSTGDLNALYRLVCETNIQYLFYFSLAGQEIQVSVKGCHFSSLEPDSSVQKSEGLVDISKDCDKRDLSEHLGVSQLKSRTWSNKRSKKMWGEFIEGCVSVVVFWNCWLY